MSEVKHRGVTMVHGGRGGQMTIDQDSPWGTKEELDAAVGVIDPGGHSSQLIPRDLDLHSSGKEVDVSATCGDVRGLETRDASYQRSKYQRSNELRDRLLRIVPGGAHTYAKGPDQHPELSPGVLVRGRQGHVWDADGNEFIEYGMGLRAVSLGHAYPAVTDAVARSLQLGTNFTRASPMELECAEVFASLIESAEMVKFTKDGSTATSGALKLARAHTGRDLVAVCADHPFFSYDDWFMAGTTMNGGIERLAGQSTLTFRYDDADSLRNLFVAHPGRIAAVILEPARTAHPTPGFLEAVRALCDECGAVLIFDEMITGFRFHLNGAQKLYGVKPDLSTFGKAVANGFALSVLCGRRDIMQLGSRRTQRDDVFLLSTTHGAEIPGLAAAVATMNVYKSEPVIERLDMLGQRLRTGFLAAAERHGVGDYVHPVGISCNLLFATKDLNGRPSQAFRTLFLQEVTRRGILMPSLVVSYSHTDEDIERTIAAIDGALAVYARALAGSVDEFLIGPPSRLVLERR